MPPISLEKYLSEMRQAMAYQGARDLYFPPNKEERIKGNLRLARELACGLKDFSADAVNNELGALYGKFIVAHSLDTTGVVINNKTWLDELRNHLA